MKVLIIRLGAIGDVVHSTIIADMIKNDDNEAVVDFLVSKDIAPLLKNHKSIKSVINFDIKKKSNYFYLFYLAMKLRREKYDVIFALTNSTRIFFLTFIANAKKMIPRSTEFWGIETFYQTALKLSNRYKKPERLNLSAYETLPEYLQKELDENDKSPIVIFNPCGLNDKLRHGRIWRDTNWIEFGNKLAEKYNAKIYITGSPLEAKFHERFKAIKNVTVLTGELSLAQSATLFSKANLVVAGDSGPLHIAAAVGVNTLGLMGSTSPDTNGPFGKNGYSFYGDCSCKFCGMKQCTQVDESEKYKPCMDAITPTKLLEFVEAQNLLTGR